MHITLYQLLLAFISFSSFAQIKTTIVDGSTNEPIPYVNVSIEGKGIELSADENGLLQLPQTDGSAIIHLSAVGFANAAIKFSDIKTTIPLATKPIELGEIAIGNKKRQNSLVINPIKKAKDTWMGVGGGNNGTLLFAKYILYKTEYASKYIDKLKFKVLAYNDNTFNVRLYTANTDGSPGDYLYNENILVKVKKGQKNADVDFSKVSIIVPDEGFFVVIEYLAIPENRLDGSSKDIGFPAHLYGYGPSFMSEFGDAQEGWSYKQGKWTAHPKTERGYARMVIEVTLTD
ncbi:carboxypeptidase-like regulatory domain-containing protein [Flavobacterium sp. DG1-102-2]|uniref:carboxypeptidase-like regulatory domain-containing protein n=1 Tax=Flavobacterium sp. DG1-102-2 TaxID=3081663 RepID=UPI00294A64C4|nr:carboxypeptidase-like regulatory domain-containing protein [Flavobacterium sp. DG1-102-2]MDV6168512.1 carboxypeptidase-like regulatory domain-containing protein [Flavobacterium sp. DG1-102-2]